MNADTPAYTTDRFGRCVERYAEARRRELFAETTLDRRLAASLAAYWERQARKAAGRC
jgi:hypothetical protein